MGNVQKGRKRPSPANSDTKKRQGRKTFAITQKGIRNDADLFDFLNAALSDIDAGRTDTEEMKRMTSVTRQMITLQNLRLKAGFLQQFKTKTGLLLKTPSTGDKAGG